MKFEEFLILEKTKIKELKQKHTEWKNGGKIKHFYNLRSSIRDEWIAKYGAVHNVSEDKYFGLWIELMKQVVR